MQQDELSTRTAKKVQIEIDRDNRGWGAFSDRNSLKLCRNKKNGRGTTRRAWHCMDTSRGH